MDSRVRLFVASSLNLKKGRYATALRDASQAASGRRRS
jgi:hypothetical protein